MPQSFDELALPEALRAAIARLGWTKPSPVQALSFDPLIAGRDVMVQSHTGSGKTGAFCVPWLASRFDARPASETGVQLLVLLPTRELAKQVCDELRRLAVETPVDVLPVYGGTPMNPQLTALRAGVHAVVGTPGRILDHIRRRSLDLSKVRTVVLDECDEMLSMGFLEDIRAILDQVKGEHLTALFSATIPNDIERIAKRYMKDPVAIQLSGDQVAAAEIEHAFYSVTSSIKTRDLLDVIMVEDPARAIIFCNTREETKLVASVLRREGFHAEELSSDLNQTQRERVMKLMREHKLRFLVATDVAARGIDISHVSHVINYSFPESAEVYVHRTGRTGRAGRTGVAISLINPREIGNFYYLKLQYASIVFSERQLPPAEQLSAERMEFKLDGISKRFPELVSPEWVLLARSLMTDPRGERVVGLLLERAMRAAPRPESVIEADAASDEPVAGAALQGRREGDEDERPAAAAAGPGETIEREQRDLREGREPREPREPRERFGDRDRGRGPRDRGDRGPRSEPRFGDRPRRDDAGPRRDDADRGEPRFGDRPRRDDEPRSEPRLDRPRRDDADRSEPRLDRPRRDDADRSEPRLDRPRRDDADRSEPRLDRPPERRRRQRAPPRPPPPRRRRPQRRAPPRPPPPRRRRPQRRAPPRRRRPQRRAT
ncbi:DEAD/DEAH box helicase [Nannocystis sp.]|uniref:DEAD/DEAH box helicase n=1 Tax=Nannocystis sp. TaxID=1962667 RepID=UPI0025DAFAB7|nr:DEAD/DEAH box helicase [Nannocystis sp.]MBK7824184.1 DEAD/DEAH box helicase [Nannocystis sp.]